MNLSKCVTMPPEGDKMRPMSPGGRGSPTYSAATRSLVRDTLAVMRIPRLSERNRPRCKKAVCGTSSAFSSVEYMVPGASTTCRTVQ